MNKVNYRHLARQALKRAEAFLASEDDASLRYAALELRLSMEALTYDRAQAYRDEIPPEQLGKWQPGQLMKLLLEIEPDVDKSYSLRIGEEPYPGGKPEQMRDLGSDTVFSMADLRNSYNAVGSMLHMPTMKQVESGEALKLESLRARCRRAAEDLAQSLSSLVWNFTVGQFASCDCVECGKRVRRRIPRGQEQLRAECFHCDAEYEVRLQGDGSILFEPRMAEIDCPTKGCNARFALWMKEVKAGAHWHCKKCGKPYEIAYGVVPLPSPNS